MRANRAYSLTVRRRGPAPAFLATRERVDHVEVVEIESGEAVLVWDLDARSAARLVRRLKSDLAQMEREAFIAAWREA